MGHVKLYLVAVFSLAAWLAVSTVAVAQDSEDDSFGAIDPQAKTAYETGVEQMEQEKWEEAISAFSDAVGFDDSFPEAYFGRAEALRQLEDYRSALENYRQALYFLEGATPTPLTASAYNGRGVCYRELDDFQLAGNDFVNAIQIDRNNPEIAANYGDFLVNHGQDPVSALDHLDTAISMNPEDAKAYRNRGVAHAQIQEFEESIKDLKKSAELDPEEYLTYSTLASIYNAREEFEQAIEAFTSAIEHYKPEKSSEPDIFISGYLSRSEARLRLALDKKTTPERRETLYNELIADTDRVLTEFPDRFPQAGQAHHQRGLAMRLQGRLDHAIKSLTDAIQLVPPGQDVNYLADAYLKRGICWHFQGQDSLARGDFEQSAGIRFDDPLPHLWIGLSYAQEENFRKAIESYGEAIAKAPTFPASYVNRGLAYMQLGGFQKAVDNFNEAIRNEPSEAEHFFKRGIAHMRMEEYQKAFDSFHLAMLNDEKMAKAVRAAANALRALDKAGLAVQYDERAKAIDAEVDEKG